MTAVRAQIHIEAPVDQVWTGIEDIGSHVRWMADAERITFRNEQRAGVGTEFECATRIGPFRTRDVMRVTEWDAPRTMGITHHGAVSGRGRFTLEAEDGGTRFTWAEDLAFPWFFGGRLGAWIATPLLRWVWQRNLRRLKHLIEQGDPRRAPGVGA